jgi:hypothetical protein
MSWRKEVSGYAGINRSSPVETCRQPQCPPAQVGEAGAASISIGHPFGMTGSRQVGHLVRELQRRNLRYGIVTMCVGGGMGATGLFEAVR